MSHTIGDAVNDERLDVPDWDAFERVRPTWHTTWREIAEVVGRRSKCSLRQVGAVIVSADNSYIVVGYNGPPASWVEADTDSCRDWCPRAAERDQTRGYDNCVSVHAETNAIAKADRTRIVGGTLYVSSSVCWDCGKVVANSGVSRVLMELDLDRDKHRDPMRTIEFLQSCGLEVLVFP